MTGDQKPGGLEVVAWRYRSDWWTGDSWGVTNVSPRQRAPLDKGKIEVQPLTPAEPAEARIRELELQRDEAVREALNATPFSRDEVRQMCEQRDELIAAAESRANAAEAQLARVIGPLKDIRAGGSWQGDTASDLLAALQQEGE